MKRRASRIGLLSAALLALVIGGRMHVAGTDAAASATSPPQVEATAPRPASTSSGTRRFFASHPHAVNIAFNGDVVLCCMDWRRQEVLGNVREQRIEEVWQSPAYWRVRDALYGGGPIHDSFLCHNGNTWRGAPLLPHFLLPEVLRLYGECLLAYFYSLRIPLRL